MNSQRGAAFNDSTQPRPAARAPTPASPDRLFVLALIVGILIGLVLAAIGGMGLYAFGWLGVGECPSALTTPGYCPPTAIYFFPECPTNEAGCFVTATPSPDTTVAPPAATPDFAATATQACSDWRSRFPGTPCPPFVTPSP